VALQEGVFGVEVEMNEGVAGIRFQYKRGDEFVDVWRRKLAKKMSVASASARCYESACRDQLWNCKTPRGRKFTFNEKARPADNG